MATLKTIQAIKNDIMGNGCSSVPFETVERILGTSYADDDDFEEAILNLMSAKSWVTGCSIDWINRKITFTGPWTETDN